MTPTRWAPAHRAKETFDLLKHETTSNFILLSSLWPPDSPDLNPVDYKCGLIFCSKFTAGNPNCGVDELRQHIIEKWERLDKLMIDNAVKQWH